MPQSLANLLVHLVFSTKNRERTLSMEIRPELYAYLGGILREMECPGLAIGGTDDHVHVLAVQSRKIAFCDLVEDVKRGSSRWIKTRGRDWFDFHWQAGYGAFSVSESNKEAVRTYIANQEHHHQRMTFQEEYRQFLEKHNIQYDEKYVWD